MNLITCEGLAMIDTDNVVQFQAKNDLHRLFAPGVIESHRAPMTTAERVLLVLIYAASVLYVDDAPSASEVGACSCSGMVYCWADSICSRLTGIVTSTANVV